LPDEFGSLVAAQSHPSNVIRSSDGRDEKIAPEDDDRYASSAVRSD
jgi:hypothetical protein